MKKRKKKKKKNRKIILCFKLTVNANASFQLIQAGVKGSTSSHREKPQVTCSRINFRHLVCSR